MTVTCVACTRIQRLADILTLLNIGLKMVNATVHIVVGLRLGAPIVRAHKCVCGTILPFNWRHGLFGLHGLGQHSMKCCVVHSTTQHESHTCSVAVVTKGRMERRWFRRVEAVVWFGTLPAPTPTATAIYQLGFAWHKWSVTNCVIIIISTITELRSHTSLVRDLHWLRVPERIAYVWQCSLFAANTVLLHLSAELTALVIPWSKHWTIGDRAFPVAAAWVWNGLPPFVLNPLHHCQYSSRDWRQSSSHARTMPLNTEQT